jgi:hypothetical protein
LSYIMLCSNASERRSLLLPSSSLSYNDSMPSAPSMSAGVTDMHLSPHLEAVLHQAFACVPDMRMLRKYHQLDGHGHRHSSGSSVSGGNKQLRNPFDTR